MPRESRRRKQNWAIMGADYCAGYCLLLLVVPLCAVKGNVAYPGIWTAQQPDGHSTGTKQVLIGTPEYYFSVVETESSFYLTMQGADGMIHFATKGRYGRFLPTNIDVGSIDPALELSLQDALQERPHVVHAQCIEQDYCKWKLQQNQRLLEQQQ